jgi:hypothetical protein
MRLQATPSFPPSQSGDADQHEFPNHPRLRSQQNVDLTVKDCDNELIPKSDANDHFHVEIARASC